MSIHTGPPTRGFATANELSHTHPRKHPSKIFHFLNHKMILKREKSLFMRACPLNLFIYKTNASFNAGVAHIGVVHTHTCLDLLSFGKTNKT